MNESYLIDTHVLIWYIQGNERLSQRVINLLNEPSNVIWLSQFKELEAYLIEKGFLIVDFTFADLINLHTLPYHHSDPFDRLLIAQSKTNKLPIISDDGKFKL